MAKTKKQKKIKKEKENIFFTPISTGAIDAIKSGVVSNTPIFSNWQPFDSDCQSPLILTGMPIITPQVVSLLELLSNIDTSFMLNEDKIIHNGYVYSRHMRGKLKMPADEYIRQLCNNALSSTCATRFKTVTDAVYQIVYNLPEADSLERSLHIVAMIMNTFRYHIIDVAFHSLCLVLYGMMYNRATNQLMLMNLGDIWNHKKTLQEAIIDNEMIQKTIHPDPSDKFRTEVFKCISEKIYEIVADEWLKTAPDNETYQKAVNEIGIDADWESIDLLKILPDALNLMREYHKYKDRYHKYNGLSADIEITRPMTSDFDYSDEYSMPTLEIPSASFMDNKSIGTNDSLFKSSWESMIEKTLRNSKSNMSIRFTSDKYRKSLRSNEEMKEIEDVIRDWSIPGRIKAIFPNRLHTCTTYTVLLADYFEFELIYKGNPDRINDYAFDDNDKLIPVLTPELYDEIYDYVKSEGNILVIRHRGRTIFLDPKFNMCKIDDKYDYDKHIYITFEFRKICHCIVDAYKYLKSKEVEGGIDFYFEEREDIIHEKSKRHQLIHRRGSFVRGHFRHYKSGVVTLVRPHVRKGTNYIGEYVLEI